MPSTKEIKIALDGAHAFMAGLDAVPPKTISTDGVNDEVVRRMVYKWVRSYGRLAEHADEYWEDINDMKMHAFLEISKEEDKIYRCMHLDFEKKTISFEDVDPNTWNREYRQIVRHINSYGEMCYRCKKLVFNPFRK